MPRMLWPLAAASLTKFLAIIAIPISWWVRVRNTSCGRAPRHFHELGQEEVRIFFDDGRARDTKRFDVHVQIDLHPLGLEKIVGFRLVLRRVLAKEVVGVGA